MRRKSSFLGLAFVLAVAPRVLAQGVPPPANFETWLMPVSESARAGAYGTLWATKVWAFFRPGNELEYVEMGPFNFCETICGTTGAVTADPPLALPVVTSEANDPPGQLFWVERTKVDRVWMKLRVQDLARTTPMKVGVEIPVVRENQFCVGGNLILLNIPQDSQLRQWLRVYDIDRKPGTKFRVIGRRQSDGAVLFDTTLPTVVLEDKFWTPGAASLDLRALLPVESGATSFLEITPSDSAVHYWAFATVTSNETQEIVTVTP